MLEEFFHHGLHSAQSQLQDVKLTKYGRISSYDPEKHAIKAIIPQDRSIEDDPYETSWIPLGSLMIGNKFGVQFAPKGGATPDEPEKGELVKITIIQRSSGLMAGAQLCYDEENEPPGSGNLSEEEQQEQEDEENKEGWEEDSKGRVKLKGGEMLIRHESGTFFKFYEDGTVQLFAKKDLHVYTKEEANVVVREGDLNIEVEKGDFNIKVKEGDFNIEVNQGDLSSLVEMGNTSFDTPLGDTSINSEEGSILLNTEMGDVAASATEGSISLDAGLDIRAAALGIIDIIAPIVNAGNPAATQALLNEVAMLIYNGHVHPAGTGFTGPPDVQMEKGLATTVEFEAS